MEFDDNRGNETLEINLSNVSVKEGSRRTLIDKIMTKKKSNKMEVRLMNLKGWNSKEVKIIDKVNDIFLFSFENSGDRARFLKDRPWPIYHGISTVNSREGQVCSDL